MSRASNRGTKEKEKTKPQPNPNQTVAASSEIVPGKFSENDWLAMVERDSAEDFIHDYVEEMLAVTMDTIHSLYISRQLVPYTVHRAKLDMLNIVEWNDLARDEGEHDMTGWIQDDEPEAKVTDCWAQGSVPKTEVPQAPRYRDEETEEEAVLERIMAENEFLAQDMDRVSEDGVSASSHSQTPAPVPIASEPKQIKQKRQSNVRKKSKKKSTVGSLSQSQEKHSLGVERTPGRPSRVSTHMSAGRFASSSSSKVQSKRASHALDIHIDEMGNVVHFVKIEPDTLPHHRVNMKYQLVDASLDLEQARLEAAVRSKTEKRHAKNVMTKTISESLMASEKTSGRGKRFIPMPFPPSLLESIDVVPGVVVSEAGRTKKLPRRALKAADDFERHLKSLQPVTLALRDRSNTLSVSDLLAHSLPTVRSLDDSVPLPPILPAAPTDAL